jgi:ATP-dependent Clp protease ATP-binding subunit ClpC
MGARPLRRVIQQKVEDRLSDALLSNEFEDCVDILVDLDGEEIVLRRGDQENKLPENTEEALAAV